jgi:hypothetical protein
MHALKQGLEARIRPQSLEQRFVFDPEHAGITLPVGAFEPLEGAVGILARRVNQRELIRRTQRRGLLG